MSLQRHVEIHKYQLRVLAEPRQVLVVAVSTRKARGVISRTVPLCKQEVSSIFLVELDKFIQLVLHNEQFPHVLSMQYLHFVYETLHHASRLSAVLNNQLETLLADQACALYVSRCILVQISH